MEHVDATLTVSASDEWHLVAFKTLLIEDAVAAEVMWRNLGSRVLTWACFPDIRWRNVVSHDLC